MKKQVLFCEFAVVLSEEEKDLLIDLADKEVKTPGEIVGKALRVYKSLGDLVEVYESNKLSGGYKDL
jgi:hypothetical protein